MTTTPEFDAAAIVNHDTVTPMLRAAAADPDPRKLVDVVSQMARVVGVAEVASRGGIGSIPSLYRSLSPGHEPRWTTIVKVLAALGYRVIVEPMPPKTSMSTRRPRPKSGRAR